MPSYFLKYLITPLKSNLKVVIQTLLHWKTPAKQSLQQAGLKPDYFSIAQRDTLKAATLDDNKFVILAAAYLGSVRLIDNLQVEV